MHSMKSDRPFAAAACQIYWPLNCQLENNHGWIIGWNLQGFLACVSCVISNDSLKACWYLGYLFIFDETD